MARGDTYTCRTCGKVYDYCEKCAIRPIPYLGNGFCSESCSDIFSILSKHGCNLATAKETLDTLDSLEGKIFTPSIQAHIDAITAEVKGVPAAKEEIVVKDDTTVVENNIKENILFSQKKKWNK